MRLPLGEHALEGRQEQVELCLPTDEHSVEARSTSGPGQGECSKDGAARDALRLSLGLDIADSPELERAAGGGDRALACEHLARDRRLLETCTDVDRISGHERASLPRAAGDDDTRVHADPQLQLVTEELTEAPLHGKRRV